MGGGTGMVCHWFKGGIGTASRRLPESEGGYTVGVLVQCNYGSRQELSIAGVPVGRALGEAYMPCFPPGSRSSQAWFSEYPFVCGESPVGTAAFDEGLGSIIVVVATDAPLLPHQLDRVAARVALGVGRMGGKGENSSGDIFLAFSTANRSSVKPRKSCR